MRPLPARRDSAERPRPARRLLACCGCAWLLALATASAAPAAESYTLDPVHTRIVFAVSHAGFSEALGSVSGASGSLWLDPQDWSTARLVVEIPLDRIDLGDGKWNAAVRAPALLDTTRQPSARFVSSRVEPNGPDNARVCGDLSLRGVTRETCLEVRMNALKRHPLPPFRRTAGFSATGEISRAAFGIDAWKTVIGDRVELRIEAEAQRAAELPAPR